MCNCFVGKIQHLLVFCFFNLIVPFFGAFSLYFCTIPTAQTIITRKTMNTTKEIRKLRKEVRALQDEVRAMRYERLDQLIADMKTAARDMLEASRVL